MRLKKKNIEDLKDVEIKSTIDKEDLEKNPAKVRDSFIRNLDENETLRKRLWEKIYWDLKNRARYRNNKNKMLATAENEWQEMDYETKCLWYDYQTNDSDALSAMGEINYIIELTKMHKGNMKKIWRDLKSYGNMKKEEAVKNEP